MLRNRKKLNNSGSTLVMAVIAIAFVALLVVTILSAAMANMKIKQMNNRSKDTFYTAETLLDEIKAGVGHDSISSMSDAYKAVLTTMVRQGDSYRYVINNDEANKEFKEKFVVDMLRKVTGGSLLFENSQVVSSSEKSVTEYAIKYVNSFIKGYESKAKTAEVKSIDKVIAVKEGNGLRYSILLQNLVIDYKQDRTNEDYYSTLTVDLDITFPNLTVDFAGGNSLSGFTEYSLITDQNLMITGKSLTVNAAHIYAGENISIAASADSTGQSGNLTVTGNMLSKNGSSTNANIVTRGDIIVRGSALYKSSFTVNSGDVWCDNLTTDSYIASASKKADTSIGADINIDAFSKTYIKDDLNLYGSDSNVIIGGNMYAYSYDGSDNTNHATSSSIIISGEGSQLRLNLNRLIVGGRSYVIIPGETYNYMTGESISVKADQELYLVPSKFIYKNQANPMATSAWTQLKADQKDPAINDTNTPLVQISGSLTEGLLDKDAPYVVKTSGNVSYLYYHFKDKASSTEYVKRILAGHDVALKQSLNSYFTSTTKGVSITAGSMYAAGALMQTSGSSVNNTGAATSGSLGTLSYANSSGVIPTDVFTLASLNYKNRYDILTHLLVDIPEAKQGVEYIVNDREAALEEFYSNYKPTGSEMTNNASANIVDYSAVESHQYNEEENLVMYDSGIIKVALNKATYVVPAEVKGGIIINTGAVKLDHDFKGLIISKGNIIITNNATVTTDAAMIENLIKNEYLFYDGATTDEERQKEETPFRNYFYAYKQSASEEDTSEPVKIENISYNDIVGTNNWRKYDDGK